MKYYFIILIAICSAFSVNAQVKVKDTPDKIVTHDKDNKVKTKEKNNEFVALSDSVKIKDRHGRKKTKDFTAHTVIKEKKNQIKFKNKADGSWMKVKNRKITKSSNYVEKDKKDSV